MATGMSDFTEILVRKGIVSSDQVSEAGQMVRETGMNLADCLTKLGYASGEDVMLSLIHI